MSYPLYKRYLLGKILKLSFFIILCFFLLYSLIDFSLHSQEFLKAKDLSWVTIFIYYGTTFIKRLELALPFSLLISTIYVLLSLGKHFELTAMQAGGLSKKMILSPFFQVAFIFSSLLLINFELVLPKSLEFIEHFERSYFKSSRLSTFSKPGVYQYYLEDGSFLIFSHYDIKNKQLSDLYYHNSIDHIWKIKKLYLSKSIATAYFAEEFKRDEKGSLRKVDSFEKTFFYHFPETLTLNLALKDKIESKSLSNLFEQSLLYLVPKSKIQREVITQLLFKLLISLLPILCVLAAAPCCLMFRRDITPFKIYSIFLISFIFFFTLLDVCVIISEISYISPWVMIPFPFLISFLTFSWIYIKKCYYAK